MTSNEFINLKKEKYDAEYALGVYLDESSLGNFIYAIQHGSKEINGYVITGVSSEGGYEGDGEHMEIIVQIVDPEGNITFHKLTGYYNSWDASSWDDKFIQVYPKQKTITVYEGTP